MNISVLGAGYVGCVTGTCLANLGHTIYFVDTNKEKVNALNNNILPVHEPGLKQMYTLNRSLGRIFSHISLLEIDQPLDAIFICVPTPTSSGGDVNSSFLFAAIESISTYVQFALAKSANSLLICNRSTTPPELHKKLIERFRLTLPGDRFDSLIYATNPEFLREGTALHDFNNPPFIIVGCDDKEDQAESTFQKIFSLDSSISKLHILSIGEAALLKYSCNSFHALKVCFANEIGIIAKSLGIDARNLMSIFTMDNTLNISKKYLVPGAPFGGSCLPKDSAYLAFCLDTVNIRSSVISSINSSNQAQLDFLLERITRDLSPGVDILISGITFKQGTDDLRYSQALQLAHMLQCNGFRPTLYDSSFTPNNLYGENREIFSSAVDNFPFLESGSSSIDLSKFCALIIFHSDNSLPDTFRFSSSLFVYDLDGKNSLSYINSNAHYYGIYW